jgi:hypothetical protein
MENRERDRVSQRTTPTEAGKLNRSVEEEKGREVNSGTDAEFGQSIGRSENLSEGGEMRNRNQDEIGNKNVGSESSRRSGSDSFGSSSGRSGSMGSNSGSSDISSDKSSDRSSSGELGSTGRSEGRH